MSYCFNVQCLLCSCQRVEIQLLPCAHYFHVRCVFPWPVRNCPMCSTHINEINIIQPTYHMVNIPTSMKNYRYINIEEIQLFGIIRRGRWCDDELAYGLLLRDLFCSNCLPLAKDTRLPDFLGQLLQCSSVRLRTKIKTGKQVYHGRADQIISKAEYNHVLNNLSRLSKLLEQWLLRVREDNFVDALIISYQTHRYWVRNFLKLYRNQYNISYTGRNTPSAMSRIMPAHILLESVRNIPLSNILSYAQSLFNHPNPKSNFGIVTSIATKDILLMSQPLVEFFVQLSEMESFNGSSFSNLDTVIGNYQDLRDCLCNFDLSPTMTMSSHDVWTVCNSESSTSYQYNPTHIENVSDVKIFQRSIVLALRQIHDYVHCHLLIAVHVLAGVSVASLAFEEINMVDPLLFDNSSLPTLMRETRKPSKKDSTDFTEDCSHETIVGSSSIHQFVPENRQDNGRSRRDPRNESIDSLMAYINDALNNQGDFVNDEDLHDLVHMDSSSRRDIAEPSEQSNGVDPAYKEPSEPSEFRFHRILPSHHDFGNRQIDEHSASTIIEPFTMPSKNSSDSNACLSSSEATAAASLSTHSSNHDDTASISSSSSTPSLSNHYPFFHSEEIKSSSTIGKSSNRRTRDVYENLDSDASVSSTSSNDSYNIFATDSASPGAALKSPILISVRDTMVTKPSRSADDSRRSTNIHTSNRRDKDDRQIAYPALARLPSIRLSHVTVEAAMKSLLKYVPFDMIELWVPVPSSSHSSHPETVTMYFAGSASTTTSFSNWSSYSRTFTFESMVGLPGRVSARSEPEIFTDISELSSKTYLRVNGAKSLGIHASVGIPIGASSSNHMNDEASQVVPKDKRVHNNAVVVFYSKKVFAPSDDLVNFMSDAMKNLKINTSAFVRDNNYEEFMNMFTQP